MISIYTRQGCAYCSLAKEFLQDKGIEFKEYEIERTITRDEVIEKFPNIKTLPIITTEDQTIGTWSDLLDWYYKNDKPS